MNKSVKMLIGTTEDNQLVFAEVSLRNYFSVSFSMVSPFVATDEYLRNYFEGYLDGIDSDTKLNYLERLDCKFSELEDELFHEQLRNCGVEGIVDISLYSDSYPVEGLEDDVYFSSGSCGQCDPREEEGFTPILESFTDKLFTMWETYHLKDIGEEITNYFENDIKSYELALQEPEWIQEWLEGLVKEGALS